MKSLLAASGLLLTLVVGCGKVQFTNEDEEKTISSQTEAGRERVDLVARMGDEKPSLMLANASEFLIKVEGCDSALTAELTHLDADASLWVGDTNCVGKLMSFRVNGITYEPASAFTTYQPGGTATFKAVGGDATLVVTVRKQIAQKITGAVMCEEVEYSFNDISEGPGKTIDPVASGVVGRVVGEQLPALKVTKARLLDLIAGVGEFDFTVRCMNVLDTACLNLIAADQSALGTVIEYLLVKDTFGGSLTMAQAAALDWSQALKLKASYTASSFQTLELLGPGPIADAANRQMLLVLRVNGSYQYFEIDVNSLPDVQCTGPNCPPPPPPPCKKQCPNQGPL